MTKIKFILPILIFAGCNSKKFEVPELVDDPVISEVKSTDIPFNVPGYGVALGSDVEVNIEAADSSAVQSGQHAVITADGKTFAGTVSRVSHSVSSETGQAIAWIHTGGSLSGGSFISVSITARVLKSAIAVPRSALFVRDGLVWVIKADGEGDKIKYKPLQVEVGTLSHELAQIKSGLSLKDRVVSEGGIGFLFPDFKAASED